jgi:hypothetical protein
MICQTNIDMYEFLYKTNVVCLTVMEHTSPLEILCWITGNDFAPNSMTALKTLLLM